MRHTRGPIPDFPRDRPTVADVQALVDEWVAAGDDENDIRTLGGLFRQILERGDVCEGQVHWALDHAHREGDELGVRLGEALASITKTQRLKLTLPYYRQEAA